MKFTKTITHIISNISVAAILAASAVLVAAQTPGNAPTTPPPGTKVILTTSGSPQAQLQQTGDEDRAPPDVTPPDNPTLPGIPGDIPFNAEVEFTDVNLAQAVRKALGKNEGDDPVRVYDLSSPSFTELWLNDGGIQNLTGLEHARFLQKLGIDDNNVSDLSPIAGLTSLSELWASNNQIENLTPLENLTGLVNLGLGTNKIDDLTALKDLTNLSWLDLGNIWFQRSNTFTDLTPLAGLTKLKGIYLCETQVSDLSPLKGMTNLQGLHIAHTNVTDLSVVENFPHLKHMTMRGGEITDYTPLASRSALKEIKFYGGTLDLATVPVVQSVERITLGWMTVENVETLKNWPNLKVLEISCALFKDYSFLNDMPDLEKVVVHARDIENASDADKILLEELLAEGILDYYFNIADPNLRKVVAKALGRRPWAGTFSAGKAAKVTKLKLADKGVKNLSGIEHFSNLEKLEEGWGNEVSDLSPLAGLIKLKHLHLAWNKEIVDVTPLAGLTELTYLNLRGNKIEDVTPLAGLTKLKHLHLAWNKEIVDVTPLAGLTELTNLDLEGNSTDFSPLAGMTNMRHISFSSPFNHNLEFLSGMSEVRLLTMWGRKGSDKGLDFSPIANLNKLEKLHVGWGDEIDFADLGFAGKADSLHSLSVFGRTISNFKEIEKLRVLNKLELVWCELAEGDGDLSSVAQMNQLKTLNLRGFKPAAYELLDGMKNLEIVEISKWHKNLDPSTPAGQVISEWRQRKILDYLVSVPDAQLKLAVRKTLNYPNNKKKVHYIDLSKMTTLDLRGYKVKDFRGLEEAVALEEIKVDMGNVADFVQIAKDNAALRDQVEDQNDTIVAQETVIDDMADTIAKQSQAIDEQNDEIARLKVMVADRDTEIERLKDIITVKDVIIAERDATIVKKDEIIAKRDATIVEKDKTIADRDATIVKKEGVIAQLQAFRSAVKNTLSSVGFNIDGDDSIVDAVKELIEMARTPFVNGWIYDPEQGWLYTDCETYPLVYSHSTASWHYYALGTCPRLFYNYSTEEWENWDPTHEHTETEVASSQGQE